MPTDRNYRGWGGGRAVHLKKWRIKFVVGNLLNPMSDKVGLLLEADQLRRELEEALALLDRRRDVAAGYRCEWDLETEKREQAEADRDEAREVARSLYHQWHQRGERVIDASLYPWLTVQEEG